VDYFIVNDTTVAERWNYANGSEYFTMRYTFDETGSVIGFSTHYPEFVAGYWEDYLFAKNLQGDVVAMYFITTQPPKLIATYEYDEWGKVKTVRDATGAILSLDAYPNHIAHVNPIRYRGYYYDNETGFYYLQSRYYDPVISRFINADSYGSTGQGFIGTNMFAYCNNNPVNLTDPSGHFGAAAAIIASAIVAITLSGCSKQPSSNVGAAKKYEESTSTKYNCYAYALGEKDWRYVGGRPDAVTDFDVDSVALMVMDDVKKLGRSIRPLESYDSPIDSNEYRIALRTGVEDYHFMVQNSDGSWSHKPGQCKTRQIDGANPSVVPWDRILIDANIWYQFHYIVEVDIEPNYYDSKTLYFAISG
jgi:RHS repeat-associated protein